MPLAGTASTRICFNEGASTFDQGPNKLRIQCDKGGGKYQRLSVQLELPQGESSFLYFETKLLSSKTPFPIFGMGVAPKKYANAMVGWYHGSIGYHADDGGLFNGSRADSNFAKYGTNDTVGCFVDLKQKKLFFTLNGTKLSGTDKAVKNNVDMYPTISFDPSEDIVCDITYNPFNNSVQDFLYKDLPIVSAPPATQPEPTVPYYQHGTSTYPQNSQYQSYGPPRYDQYMPYDPKAPYNPAGSHSIPYPPYVNPYGPSQPQPPHYHYPPTPNPLTATMQTYKDVMTATFQQLQTQFYQLETHRFVMTSHEAKLLSKERREELRNQLYQSLNALNEADGM